MLASLAVSMMLVVAAFVILTNNPDNKRECDVVVTMAWQKEMVDIISQGELDVVVLMDPNTSPHSAYSSTSSIEYLYNATLFIEIGSGVEWEISMLHGVKADLSTPTISCMELLERGGGHHHGGHDHGDHDDDDCGCGGHDEPHVCDSHIWANPEYLWIIATELAEELLTYFPWLDEDSVADGLDYYLNDPADGLGHIMLVIDRIVGGTESRANASGQTILVWHNAWAPLMEYINEAANKAIGDDIYDEDNPYIKVVSGEPTGGGGSVTPSSIIDFLDGITFEHKKYIYVSPFDTAYQYKSTFEDHGYTVVLVNPTAENWLTELDDFVHHLRDTLDRVPVA